MKQRTNSILTSTLSECYLCGRTYGIEIHEIYYGQKDREKSIDWGCYVGLCQEHHRTTRGSVHFNHDLDLRLKRECQRKFEELHGGGELGKDCFKTVFNKNYL